MMVDSFLPANNGSVTVAVGAAASATAIPGGVKPAIDTMKTGGQYLLITNLGAIGGVTVFFETSPGGSAVATVANSTPVPGGTSRIFRRGMGDDTISLIASAAGPTNVVVTVGNGI
jgi:hypothetical protein